VPLWPGLFFTVQNQIFEALKIRTRQKNSRNAMQFAPLNLCGLQNALPGFSFFVGQGRFCEGNQCSTMRQSLGTL
jgi:hypothetical protein